LICSSCKGSNFGCFIQNLITNLFSKCHPWINAQQGKTNIRHY
jgi:hypothetical protein